MLIFVIFFGEREQSKSVKKRRCEKVEKRENTKAAEVRKVGKMSKAFIIITPPSSHSAVLVVHQLNTGPVVAVLGYIDRCEDIAETRVTYLADDK